jgi:NADPH-dependent curcumin reductase CurA
MSNQIPATYTRIVLQERPKKGPITETTFRAEEGSTEELKTSLGDNDVLIRVDYVSLDPAMRGWLNDARSYVEPVAIGAVMRASGLGTVVAVGKDVKSAKVGDLVNALTGSCDPLLQKGLHILTISQGGLNTPCFMRRPFRLLRE